MVPAPTSSRVAISTGFRPYLSPKYPKRIPPKGRTMKPTPKVAKERRVPTRGSNLGKNSGPNTNAAAVPYRKKSYHSSAEPMVAEKITPRGGWVGAAASFDDELLMETSPVIWPSGLRPRQLLN